MPEQGRFFPSRKYVTPDREENEYTLLTPRSWSKQIVEHEKKLKEEGQ
jgi:hypothetical protein